MDRLKDVVLGLFDFLNYPLVPTISSDEDSKQ